MVWSSCATTIDSVLLWSRFWQWPPKKTRVVKMGDFSCKKVGCERPSSSSLTSPDSLENPQACELKWAIKMYPSPKVMGKEQILHCRPNGLSWVEWLQFKPQHWWLQCLQKRGDKTKEAEKNWWAGRKVSTRNSKDIPNSHTIVLPPTTHAPSSRFLGPTSECSRCSPGGNPQQYGSNWAGLQHWSPESLDTAENHQC